MPEPVNRHVAAAFLRWRGRVGGAALFVAALIVALGLVGASAQQVEPLQVS